MTTSGTTKTSRPPNHPRPKTLAEIDPHAEVDFTWTGVVRSDAALAALAMGVIALWSWVDAAITELITAFLDANFSVVSEMMSGLRSARMSAIRAAAKANLNPNERTEFNKILDATLKAKTWSRDLYAHSLWVYSPQAPTDVLLLLPPKDLVRKNAEVKEAMMIIQPILDRVIADPDVMDTLSEKDFPGVAKIDRSAIKVIDLEDLDGDLQMAHKALVLIRKLLSARSADSPLRAQAQAELPSLLAELQSLVKVCQERRS